MEKAMSTRESRYVRVARIAYHLTQRTLPQYTHPKSPHRFTQPQLAACVLLMFYLNLSYRDMEEWLLATDQVCRVLELKRVPDHSTLSRAFKRLRLPQLAQMKAQLLANLDAGGETAVAVDSTGFSPTCASAYYRMRNGYQYTAWLKGVYAVGTRSLLILAWRQDYGPSHDAAYLNGLRRDIRRYGRHERGRRAWALLGDKGFDGRSTQPTDLIPPVRKRGQLIDPERRARADLVAAARLDGLFGQRWKSETVHSVIKRKFGDTIRSHKRSLQRREAIVKGLIYDLHV